MDDLISKQAAIDDAHRQIWYRMNPAMKYRIDEWLEALPTVSGKDWIPCSKKMPEEKDSGIFKKLGVNKKSDYVLVTVEVKGERMTSTACTHDGVWDWGKKYSFPDYKIVAWKPYPSPYQPKEKA